MEGLNTELRVNAFTWKFRVNALTWNLNTERLNTESMLKLNMEVGHPYFPQKCENAETVIKNKLFWKIRRATAPVRPELPPPSEPPPSIAYASLRLLNVHRCTSASRHPPA